MDPHCMPDPPVVDVLIIVLMRKGFLEVDHLHAGVRLHVTGCHLKLGLQRTDG